MQTVHSLVDTWRRVRRRTTAEAVRLVVVVEIVTGVDAERSGADDRVGGFLKMAITTTVVKNTAGSIGYTHAVCFSVGASTIGRNGPLSLWSSPLSAGLAEITVVYIQQSAACAVNRSASW
jgi:hypothetical protein